MECKCLLDFGLALANGDNDGMPSIITSCTPRTNVDVSGEDIDELAFALVAPLRT
jgi:hypothetical protein